MSDGDDGIPDLTEAELVRIRATESDVTAMGDALRNGTATHDDVEGALARLRSLDIDPQKQRNALHVPADAGPHSTALETILRRIPDGWGRWISVDAGWYPLVIATDDRLAELDDQYVVQQIKEVRHPALLLRTQRRRPQPRPARRLRRHHRGRRTRLSRDVPAVTR
ncbi:hypothetical protein [Mycolicibacterium sp. P1-5]|uniref:hypothetical protein n=1 Tax=Mycolicibacterium sp. P1-5 TaxID=2024617 RepID=UPI0011ECB842|nr:hypothetical protein [Mycolicibacterium sp. P1-5]KAA0109928.1 hypothetical protein CIW47_10130 [Mycolicibacterium sp. P1-5]